MSRTDPSLPGAEPFQGYRRPLTIRLPHGATAVMGGRRSLRPSPYLVFGTLFWVLMTAAAWRVPICCDFGQHAAVVERLKASLLDPAHPTVAAPGDGSAYYSPYAVVQGVLAKVTGLAGWQIVKLSGAVNLLVLLTGIGRFVKALTPNRWAPLLALACMVLLWGTKMAWWSGYLGLMSMTGHLPFPSTFAIGLAFWAWAWTARLARAGGPLLSYAGLGALCGLILLVHPISSVAALIGVVAFAVGWSRQLTPGWGLVVLAAVAVVLVWPYYSVFSLIGDSSIDGMHRQLYESMPERFWLALLGLPALAARWWRDRRDPLVLMFVLGCLTVAYGWLSGHYTYGRIMGLTLVPLQFALAVELTGAGRSGAGRSEAWGRDAWGREPWMWGRRRWVRGRRSWVWRRRWMWGRRGRGRGAWDRQPWLTARGARATGRRGWGAARRVLGVLCAGALALSFFSVQAGAVVPRALDPVGFDQPPRWPSYSWAARRIGPGEVVLTTSYRATRSLPGYGPNLVAPPWPDTSMPERERARRAAAVQRYLSPDATPSERAAVVDEFHITWLLLTPSQRLPQEARVVAWGPRTGEVLARLP